MSIGKAHLGGIRNLESDQPKIIDTGNIKFDPNREKSKMEKDWDSLLFGGGPPRGKKQPKPDSAKPKEPQKPKEQDKRPSPPPQKIKPIVDNFVREQEIINKVEEVEVEEIAKQPEQYVIVDMGQPYRMELEVKVVYNRPIYIRKFKKIAEDFGFDSQNRLRNVAVDVSRPKECDRELSIKARTPEFLDSEFPPNERALGKNLRGLVSEWKRLGSIAKHPSFGKYIDPNDIQAGRFSSPEFLSTLSCLAESERNIKRIIENQKFNIDGFYFVRINLNSVWRYVVVDDYIPLLSGQPAGATSFLDAETDLWVAMVQKAYAKLFLNGYQLFSKVQAHDFYLRDLTGAPAQTYPMNNPDIMDIVQDALKKGHAILAVGNQQALNVGLNPNYSFNVINCNGKSFQLRSSWGSIAQKPQLNTSKEGVFEMSYSQAKQFLNHVIIARVNVDYHSSVIQSQHKKNFYGSFSFSIRENVEGILSLTQMDDRLFPSFANYSYSPFRFILEKKTSENSATYVNAVFGKFRNIDLEVNLTPGEYFVHCIADWVDKDYDYFLSFYGTHLINFKRIYSREFPNIVTQSIQAVNIKNGKQTQKGQTNQYLLYHQPTNCVIFTVQNTSDKPTDASGDLSKIDFKGFSLVNARTQQETFHDKSKNELQQLVSRAHSDRRWSVKLQPRESHTWILSTNEPYHADNLKKWGFVK